MFFKLWHVNMYYEWLGIVRLFYAWLFHVR